MKKVLITGANGFAGVHTARFFLGKQYDVLGWDVAQTAQSIIPVAQVDMLDYDLVKQKITEAKPDIVIHCAGSADVVKSVQNPNIDFENNVTATHNLLFAIHSNDNYACRIVFLSSAAIYGNPQKLPIQEESSHNPLSPYALHKVMGEQICEYFIKNYLMDIKILRIFSAYGAGLKKQIFWDMSQKIKKTGMLELFGTGNESRDYINIDDLVEAIYTVASYTGDFENIINVANGKEEKISKVAEIYAKEYGIEVENISYNGIVREGEPLNWCADISRLKSLGYVSKVDIYTGIRRYIEWVKENC